MRKRIMALFLVAVLCLSAAGCVSKQPVADNPETQMTTCPTESTGLTTEPTQTDPVEDTTPPAEGVTPLLYKVTDGDGDIVWLFGAIHLGQDHFYPLPEYVMEAYRTSDALAVELDIVAFEKDFKAQIRALQGLIYKDGTRISDHIPQELYDESVEILKESKLYNPAMDSYLPAMWFMLVDNASFLRMELDAALGIDRHFLNQAKKDGKEIREIESAEFQYSMLGQFSEPLQIMLLESSVEAYKTPELSKEQIEQLLEYWSRGDEEGLAMQQDDQQTEMTEEEARLLEEYNTAMYTDRNNAMTEYAVDALEAGGELFICVGAAHIVGEGAMAEQLRERGYTVEIIS